MMWKNLRRISAIGVLAATTGVLRPPRIHAQSVDARPSFAVASIKPHISGASFGGTTSVSPGTMKLDNRPLWHLIRMAYAVMDFQIAGAPQWVNSEGFDIVAKADGDVSAGRMLLLLRTLIEDRFQLKVHREVREGPVYDLTVAKSGIKLQKWKEGSCLPLDSAALSTFQPPAPGQTRPPMCDIRTGNGPNRTVTATGAKIGMPDLNGVAIPPFTFYLSQILNRTVIDKSRHPATRPIPSALPSSPLCRSNSG